MRQLTLRDPLAVDERPEPRSPVAQDVPIAVPGDLRVVARHAADTHDHVVAGPTPQGRDVLGDRDGVSAHRVGHVQPCFGHLPLAGFGLQVTGRRSVLSRHRCCHRRLAQNRHATTTTARPSIAQLTSGGVLPRAAIPMYSAPITRMAIAAMMGTSSRRDFVSAHRRGRRGCRAAPIAHQRLVGNLRPTRPALHGHRLYHLPPFPFCL